MKRIGIVVALMGLVGSSVWAQPMTAPIDKKTKTGKAYVKPDPLRFVRLREDLRGKPVALQTANIRYEPVDGSRLAVTLYGAVHIGDKDYYARLNRAFAKHEVLLYELANDPSVLKQRDDSEPSLFSMLQIDMGESLGLADQLEEIDYDRPNFVHADIPFDQLMQHAEDQGDDMLTMAAQTLLDVQRMMNRGDDPLGMMSQGGDAGDPFAAMLGMQDPGEMKQQMAQQLAQQANDGILEGITVLNKYLINARNQRCLDVFEEQLAAGKTDVAIFYGAGHNADFHRRLMADYALRPVEVTWVDAWDLTAPVKPRKPKRVDEMSDQELMMTLLRRMMEE